MSTIIGGGLVPLTNEGWAVTEDSKGNISVSQIQGASATPTLTAGPALGTSPTIQIIGTNISGYISLKVGTSPITGVIATLTFAGGYQAVVAACVLFPAGVSAGAILSGGSAIWLTSTTTTIVIHSGATALVAGTTYAWNYICIG